MKLIKYTEQNRLHEWYERLGSKSDKEFFILKLIKQYSSNFSVVFGGNNTLTLSYKTENYLHIDNLYKIIQMSKHIINDMKNEDLIYPKQQDMDLQNKKFSIKLKLKQE